MIDLVWNFPLLAEQQGIWSEHLAAAMAQYGATTVESQRPSFLNLEPELRARAAAFLGTPVERTWITCGGHHGTLTALLASGLAGSRVAVEALSYPGFLDQCRMTATEFVPVAVDEHGMVPEALRELCVQEYMQGRAVRGLFTMPSVQNPLGFVTPLARRRELAALAKEFDLTIIEDDAYGFLADAPQVTYAELAPECTYYVRGLAKSFSPGARTGFLVAPEHASDAMVTALRCTATGTDLPQNLASLAICEDGSLTALMEKKRVEGAARNAAVRELLGAAGVAVAAGAKSAWHVWLPFAESVDVGAVVAAMKRQDVYVSSGKHMGAGPEHGQGMRLALGAEVERERMLEGVRRLAAVLQEMQEQGQRT